MTPRLVFAALAQGLVTGPSVVPRSVRVVAHALALIGGMAAFVWTIAMALGFTAQSTGQRFKVIEDDHKSIRTELTGLHQTDSAMIRRLNVIERVGCVQLTIRERDLVEGCYGTPLSPERIRHP